MAYDIEYMNQLASELENLSSMPDSVEKEGNRRFLLRLIALHSQIVGEVSENLTDLQIAVLTEFATAFCKNTQIQPINKQEAVTTPAMANKVAASHFGGVYDDY